MISLVWMSLSVLVRAAASSGASASVGVSPSNDTVSLVQHAGKLRWLLTDPQQPSFPSSVNLAPLTVPLADADYDEFMVNNITYANLKKVFR